MEAAGGDSQRLWSETVGRRKKRNDEWWNLAAGAKEKSNTRTFLKEQVRGHQEGIYLTQL